MSDPMIARTLLLPLKCDLYGFSVEITASTRGGMTVQALESAWKKIDEAKAAAEPPKDK